MAPNSTLSHVSDCVASAIFTPLGPTLSNTVGFGDGKGKRNRWHHGDGQVNCALLLLRVPGASLGFTGLGRNEPVHQGQAHTQHQAQHPKFRPAAEEAENTKTMMSERTHCEMNGSMSGSFPGGSSFNPSLGQLR